MKILLAQLNFVIGDFEGNTDKMIKVIKEAPVDVNLIVFSELAVSGYPPLDLINQPDFLRRQGACVNRIVQATAGHTFFVLFGQVAPNHTHAGKSYFNAATLASQGQVYGQYHKQLLPTYDVFDEDRYFEAGDGRPLTFEIEGKRIGVLICEDCWNDKANNPMYLNRPVRDLTADVGVDYVVTINASPLGIGKDKIRYEMFAEMAKEYDVNFIYVNQVGGNDDILFDGGSFIVNSVGQMWRQLSFFKEELYCYDDSENSIRLAVGFEGYPKDEFLYHSLVMGIRDYVSKCGFESVVVGSSGGIDSAVTLALAVAALGRDNVHAITMPTVYSSEGSVDDSQILCNNLGIHLDSFPIQEIFNLYKTNFLDLIRLDPEETGLERETLGLEWENLQPRIRGTILMLYSNRYKKTLVLSTGNKSELSVGYCTLYGDMAGGLGVLGDIYKGEVFSVARFINELHGKEVIPVAIIDKAPSAELAPGQKDSNELPPYSILDFALRLYIEGDLSLVDDPEDMGTFLEAEAYARQSGLDFEGFFEKIRLRVNNNEFKRKQAPPVLRVRSHAFGAGRRLPVARKN